MTKPFFAVSLFAVSLSQSVDLARLNAMIPAQIDFFLKKRKSSFVLFCHDKSVHTHTQSSMCAWTLLRYWFFQSHNHNKLITSCDWLVIHRKIMAIIFIYYFLQPFAVVGCVRHVTICRVGLYTDFIKLPFWGCFS